MDAFAFVFDMPIVRLGKRVLVSNDGASDKDLMSTPTESCGRKMIHSEKSRSVQVPKLNERMGSCLALRMQLEAYDMQYFQLLEHTYLGSESKLTGCDVVAETLYL